MVAGWYQVAGSLGVAPAWRQMSSTTASRIEAGKPVGSTTYPSASRALRAAALSSNHVLRPVSRLDSVNRLGRARNRETWVHVPAPGRRHLAYAALGKPDRSVAPMRRMT